MLHNKLMLTPQHMFSYLDQGQTTPPRESSGSEQVKLCMSYRNTLRERAATAWHISPGSNLDEKFSCLQLLVSLRYE